MLSKYILLACSVSSLALGGIVQRNADTVLADLKIVDTDVKNTNAKVSSITNPAQGTQIVSATNADNTLIAAIKQTTTECNNTPANQVSAAQASAIIAYCVSPLEPDIRALTQNIISKRQATNNFRTLVLTQLKYTQGNTTLLNNCLLSRVPSTPTSLRPAASSCVSKVNADIASAVAAYSS